MSLVNSEVITNIRLRVYEFEQLFIIFYIHNNIFTIILNINYKKTIGIYSENIEMEFRDWKMSYANILKKIRKTLITEGIDLSNRESFRSFTEKEN